MTQTTNDTAEALAKAIETTTQWRATISTIETAVATATSEISGHELTRSSHALAAAMGEAKASKTLEAAHEAQHRAEMHLADLRAALEQAKPKLKEAEVLEGVARRAVNLEIARSVVEKRIAAAAKVDSAALALADALAEYESHWDTLANINEVHNGAGTSTMENRRGVNRIKAALPIAIQRAFDLRTEQQSSLARSEELTWRGAF